MSLFPLTSKQYNDDIVLPFIRLIRQLFGWVPGQPVPEWLEAVLWSDGDIAQLQTFLFEAREALDEAERLVRNKHTASSTGTQQPLDLSPVFKLIKAVQKKLSGKASMKKQLIDAVHDLFDNFLKKGGLDLDGNPRKKKGLIDLLLTVNEMLDKCATEGNFRKGATASGQIDEETGMWPNFDNLMQPCKRWGSCSKKTGLPKSEKDHVRNQFQHLGRKQLENGGLTYEDMKEAGLPLDINSNGEEIDEDKPTGPEQEWKQPAKTINHERKKRWRAEKRRQHASEAYNAAIVKYNTIKDILAKNSSVENEITARIEARTGSRGACLDQATVDDIYELRPADKMRWLIHARRFTGGQFQPTKLCGASGKLNRTVFRDQTAADIEGNCNAGNPCLVWWAWKLCIEKAPIVLVLPPEPVLNVTLPTPTFNVVYAGPGVSQQSKLPSDYLQDSNWLASFHSSIKGVVNPNASVDTQLLRQADKLLPAMRMRLQFHISDRVHEKCVDHFALAFVADNFAPMAAAMCLAGHIVDDIDAYGLEECLLKPPSSGTFAKMSESLRTLEGCYLFYDKVKNIWIRSGKTSGNGPKSNFIGRGQTHIENSKKVEQMKIHPLYQLYPSEEAENIGGRRGYFENIVMYVAMAFDKTDERSVAKLCSSSERDSFLVWSDRMMEAMRKKGDNLRKVQLEAVAYLWEICYDVLLANVDNVSKSPGFESFGLRSKMVRER